ncbi:MAG: lysophospholipid acyltransferase family protein [Pseudomonadota bacterium]
MEPAPPELASDYESAAHYRIPWERIVPFLALAALLVPPSWLIARIFPNYQPWLTKPFHQLVCWALGITVVPHGRRARGTVLYLANHVSWADVPALGVFLRARFVAKADLADDGLMRFLAEQQRTLFIERERPQEARRQSDAITAALRSGDSVIMFPEATTSDARRPLPFKSALLEGVAESRLPGVKIQPVSIAYTRVRSMPSFRGRWPQLAWIGDYGIWESAVQFLRLRAVRIDIVFHDPLDPQIFDGRKALTAKVHQIVSRGYRQAMRDYVRPA